MKWFYDLKIANKLVTSFLAVLVLTSLLGIFSIYQLSTVSSTSAEIANKWLPDISVALKMKVALVRYRLTELQHILATDAAALQDEAQTREIRLAEIRKFRETYDALNPGDDEKLLSQEFNKTLADYVEVDNKTIALSAAGQKDEARQIFNAESAMKLYQKLNVEIDDMVKRDEARGAQSAATASTTYVSARAWIIALLLGNVAIGLLLAFWLARLVSRPMNQAVAVATRVAHGDLTADVGVTSHDEIGQLMSALRLMTNSLQKIVGGVRTGTDSIATASSQIASGNTDLSARTEEQAASLEETAASMTQLTETVKQNADNARQANTLATRATDMADAGNDAVQGMVQTIGEISGSSTKISEITGTIEGIAFQTNILALNAAVEAARAGEQGRGFAVVASEVRSLAQRSAAAAKEIKELIGSSVAMIQDGAKQATEVGATMEEVKQAIKQVSDIVGEIAAASEEQGRGIEQVNQAVSQMDEVTQQNAALVEQAAAAAHSLEEQAQTLKTAVAVFKLADTETLPTQTSLSGSQSLLPVRSKPAVHATRKSGRATGATTKATLASSAASTVARPADESKDAWETF